MDITDIQIKDYNYQLPDDRIAKRPLAERDKCKLLVRSADGCLSEHRFDEISQLLDADSMLVYNNTRVINARLRFHKDSGALIEVFCLEPVSPRDYAQSFAAEGRCSWLCFVGNSKRWKEGALSLDVVVGGTPMTLHARRVEKTGNASIVEFEWNEALGITFSQIIDAAGEIPIPPYLNRSTEKSDSVDYQTVYSRIEGSVAAPTAGLHFTPEVLEAVDRKGILRRELTLHVGAGTFQPVKSERIGDHDMHSEFISVGRELISELMTTTRRIVAVGTTSVRTLESLYHIGCMLYLGRTPDEVPQWFPYEQGHPALSRAEAMKCILDYLDGQSVDRLVASTRIIIVPGYEYKMVDGIITNFHQPQSTLLLLVSAFVGGNWRPMYDYALSRDFRFLSYGDASLLLR